MSLPTSSRARFMAESRRRPVPAFMSRSAARTMAFVRSPSSICDSASFTRGALRTSMASSATASFPSAAMPMLAAP